MSTDKNLSNARKRICVISLALPIETDPRTLRQVEYLSTEYDVTLIGFGSPPLTLQQVTWRPVDRSTSRSRLLYEVLLLFLGRFVPDFYRLWLKTRPRYQQSLRYALESHAHAYHASDWATVYVAVEAARQYGAKVVFDADEYWPKFNETSRLWMTFFAPLIRFVLRTYAPEIDRTINVSEPIAERFKAEYGLDYIIVYNVPDYQELPVHVTDKAHIRLIHHGSVLRNRKLENMIFAVPMLDAQFSLDFMLTGESGYLDELKSLAARIEPNRIRFRASIPLKQVMGKIADSDIGLCYMAPTTYTWQMALPNKLFEFMMAGLAVISGPSPAMADIIHKYGVGWVAPSFSPEDLAATLNALTIEQIENAKAASREAAKSLNAQREIGKILTLYQDIL